MNHYYMFYPLESKCLTVRHAHALNIFKKEKEKVQWRTAYKKIIESKDDSGSIDINEKLERF